LVDINTQSSIIDTEACDWFSQKLFGIEQSSRAIRNLALSRYSFGKYGKEFIMRHFVFLFLALALILCAVPSLMADRLFYDNFENKDFTSSAWKPGAAGTPNYELSADFSHSPGGKTCIKLVPLQMQDWKDMWHTFDPKLKPARVRVWFYERGWKNKIKVDQQYLLVGDGTTDQDSSSFCQIGQTGNPNYDGHYAIFNNVEWVVSKTTSDEPRWVKMEFVLYEDGTARIFIDGAQEFEFPQKWPGVGTIGLASYGRNDRGGVIEGYWDDVEVYDTTEIPPSAVNPNDKLPILWSKIKLNG